MSALNSGHCHQSTPLGVLFSRQGYSADTSCRAILDDSLPHSRPNGQQILGLVLKRHLESNHLTLWLPPLDPSRHPRGLHSGLHLVLLLPLLSLLPSANLPSANRPGYGVLTRPYSPPPPPPTRTSHLSRGCSVCRYPLGWLGFYSKPSVAVPYTTPTPPGPQAPPSPLLFSCFTHRAGTETPKDERLCVKFGAVPHALGSSWHIWPLNKYVWREWTSKRPNTGEIKRI